MNKKVIIALALTLSLSTIATVQAQKGLGSIVNNLSQDKIANGLKEALDKGITDQVSKLTQKDGFLKNELVKIALPEEVQKVDKALRSMGMGSIADEGITLVNRAAESAVKEATPIFIEAVKNITFTDATNILLGDNNAATTFLQKSTSAALQQKFAPIIQEQLAQVGADKAWDKIFTTYNNLPLVKPVNTNLTEYVTSKTMDGVFKMIAVEESEIRNNTGDARSTKLLKEVFGSQDKTTKTNKTTTKDEAKSSNPQILNKLFGKKQKI